MVRYRVPKLTRRMLRYGNQRFMQILPRLIEDMERGPHLKCPIAACSHDLDDIITCKEATEKGISEIEVQCDNGVGFMHVLTKQGKHIGIERRDRD